MKGFANKMKGSLSLTCSSAHLTLTLDSLHSFKLELLLLEYNYVYKQIIQTHFYRLKWQLVIDDVIAYFYLSL